MSSRADRGSDSATGTAATGTAATVTEEPSRTDAAQVEQLRAFVGRHGGSGTAVINYLGRVGARVVVVAADGAFGDAVVSTLQAAADVCERAGIPVADEWDRRLSASVTPSAADRRRMAGTGR